MDKAKSLPHPNDGDSLLGRFGGERPTAQPWFAESIAFAPERSHFEVEGANIELLTWGEVGKPGLLFLHGNAAHADWWSFLAPMFANDFRCAAISWSGMGGSEWRDTYRIPLFAQEALTAIEVARLNASGDVPAIVAHSFGGFPTLYLASEHPQAIAGAILVDSAPAGPGRRGPPPRLSQRDRDHRVYPTLPEALDRFRFLPEQDSGDPAIIDFLARGSLREVPAKDGTGGGWTWRFDPRFWQKFDRTELSSADLAPKAPLGVIHGEKSALFPPGTIEEMRDRFSDLRFVTELSNAHHHVMVDEPLALVDAIREGLPKLR